MADTEASRAEAPPERVAATVRAVEYTAAAAGAPADTATQACSEESTAAASGARTAPPATSVAPREAAADVCLVVLASSFRGRITVLIKNALFRCSFWGVLFGECGAGSDGRGVSNQIALPADQDTAQRERLRGGWRPHAER